MTAIMATATTSEANATPDETTAMLWAAIEPEFLSALRWSTESRVLVFPANDPLLGWTSCKVTSCEKSARSSWGLCAACTLRWRKTEGRNLEEFLSDAKPAQRCVGVGPCAVKECQRPWKTGRLLLCVVHDCQRRQTLRLSMESFLTHPDVVSLPALGPCMVAACTRARPGNGPYCHAHQQRWQAQSKRTPGLDVEVWRRTATAVAENNEVSLRGLPPHVVAEVIYGLQQRYRSGSKTRYWDLRPLCTMLRQAQVRSLDDLPTDRLTRHMRVLRTTLSTATRRLGLTPETERIKDVWDLTVFGHRGTLSFTGISQAWLREAAKRWAFDDLPKRRGKNANVVAQNRVSALTQLSDSLRLQRDDNGNDVAKLGRHDISAFCNRLAYLTDNGAISAYQRLAYCRYTRWMLNRMRSIALTKSGEPLHGLPDDFALGPDDIPDEPEDTEAGKDLPTDVMRHLCQHLARLDSKGAREVRVAVELLIDTGRRPDEICRLGLDCLQQDGDGKPVLIYDNHKGHRLGRRLPIPPATAALIVKQQNRVRDRFPGLPAGQLKLLPSPTRNPEGRRAISTGWVSRRHREWVDGLPDIDVPSVIEHDGHRVTKMLPFDKRRIFLYAYRHTYAQRHADAGVDVTVLQELMDHRLLSTTQGYYQVGEQRRREAVERVTVMQFDRHGNRIWRQAKALLDSEHARRAVGEVAVPYGGCSEPSNVAAGGQDCPLRFRCVGCGHFSTDISYLPDLERYLADLLRHRERLAATLDADEWARNEALPSDQEITRIRRLIDRMKGDLDELSDEDRAEIEDAVAVVRRSRGKIVGLGMPRIRQPLPDVRPERIA